MGLACRDLPMTSPGLMGAGREFSRFGGRRRVTAYFGMMVQQGGGAFNGKRVVWLLWLSGIVPRDQAVVGRSRCESDHGGMEAGVRQRLGLGRVGR